MVRLTNEQLENLKKFYELKREENKSSIEMIKATSKPIVCDGNSIGDSVDYQTRKENANLNATISFAEYILDNHEIIEVIDDGKVNIGTTFTATLNLEGAVSTTTKTLLETLLPSDDYRKNISLESAVGKAIYGKSAGEMFNCTNGNSTITITINEIINNKKLTR